MDERETMEAQALIGEDAQAFLRSDLGKTVLGMAQQEAEQAMDALKSVSVTDTDRVRELQNIIWRSERFEEWLNELIADGEQALRVLQHEDETHE